VDLRRNAGGLYIFRDTPFRYDVSALIGDEVIAFRDAALRFLELTSERDAPIKAFEGNVALTVTNAPRPGNLLAFFVSGDDIVGISGTLSDGLRVATRTFDNDKGRIHVVEYPETIGLAGAVAKGSVDVRVRSGETTAASVTLDAVTDAKATTFSVNPKPPSDFPLEDVELFLDFGTRLSRTMVRTLPRGTKIVLPIMSDAVWLARTKATRSDGALTTNGMRPFGPGDSVELALYAPPDTVRNDGNVLLATSAQGKGVFEHVLAPVAGAGGGKTIHVFSATEETSIPDLQVLGLPPARGDYQWTVRVFPDFAFVENMSGIDSRIYWPSSTSPPKTITLR
jgi:hypothetical protein